MKFGIGLATSALAFLSMSFLSLPGLAVDCVSSGGHIDGQPASVVRQATLLGDRLSLKGGFDQASVVSCTSVDTGVWCRNESGPLDVTVIATGNKLLESIADRASGREQVGLAYICDGPLVLTPVSRREPAP